MRRLLLPAIVLFAMIGIPSTGSTHDDLTGEPCPDRVHRQYVAEGPDGELYPTWHPRIDPIHGCYYEHEHGSDPATVHPDWTPLFGYTANVEFGHVEPHHGYKTFSFRGDDLTRWGFVVHLGTHGHGRACAQFHTFDVAVADYAYVATLKADVHLLGNFGAGQVWDDGTGVRIPDTTCPGNSEIVSDGLRRFAHAADPSGAGYEVWRTDRSLLPAVGVQFGHLHIATDDPMQICEDADCAEMIVKDSSFRGVHRWMNTASGNTGPVSVENPGAEATFYTDAFGTGPGNVQQFIWPGVEFTAERLDVKCKEVGLPGLMCPEGVNVNLAATTIDTLLLTAPN